MNGDILKYFDPETTIEEKERIVRELNTDPGQKREFEQFVKAWSLSAIADKDHGLNLEEEYNQWLNKIRKSESPISKERTISVSSLLKMAATFIVLIGLGIIGYIIYQPKELLAYNEISTKIGEKAQVTLSDGTRIWLNASSKIRYPSNLNSKNVHVYLQGEAYFDVKHNENRLFQVHASSLNIKVLGTAFNVKSYPEENIIETTLIRGKVRIEGKNPDQDNYVILLPNQKASYVGKNDKLIVTESITRNIQDKAEDIPEVKEIARRNNATLVLSNNVNTTLETSWKDGRLEFEDEQFSSLAIKMERWFGVTIKIADHGLEKVRYTGIFEKESINQALQALSLSLPFKYIISKDSIVITSK
jgi:transmembrane sensor